MGEKSGWTYIDVPADLAQELWPGNKKSFRVKGMLDGFEIKGVALMPMGNGNFIMPLNAAIRKGIGKKHGAMLAVKLEVDESPILYDSDFMDCLADEPEALVNFRKLPKSHQTYYSNWIESAKTEPTKAKRIAQSIEALSKGMHYGQMIRALKETKTNN